jgi:hypothetical protein
VEQVLVGNMLPGGTPFNDENVNLTWKAHVQTNDGVKVAFVKIIDARSVYVECVCAVIGRYLGLPIPSPIIVKVTNVALQSVPEGQMALAFGSEDAQYPSFRRFMKSDSAEAMAKLDKFSKTLDVGVFDEWIANWDRNLGNMLYDGNDDFYFIDHENAIPAELCHSEPATGNEILRCLYTKISEFEKHQISKRVASDYIPNYTNLPFPLISEKTLASKYLDEAEILSVITFLTGRLQSLNSLFDKRIGIKQHRLAI